LIPKTCKKLRRCWRRSPARERNAGFALQEFFR
jgi:hypothetical protein